MQAAAAGDAVLQMHVEPHRALGAVGREVAEAARVISVRIRPPDSCDQGRVC